MKYEYSPKQQKDLLKKLQSARKELDVEKAVEHAVINMIEALEKRLYKQLSMMV